MIRGDPDAYWRVTVVQCAYAEVVQCSVPPQVGTDTGRVSLRAVTYMYKELSNLCCGKLSSLQEYVHETRAQSYLTFRKVDYQFDHPLAYSKSSLDHCHAIG